MRPAQPPYPFRHLAPYEKMETNDLQETLD
jgi:hypothetical protein